MTEAPVYELNPTSVTDPAGLVHTTSNPIGWVMALATKGAEAVLYPGQYPAPMSIVEVRPSLVRSHTPGTVTIGGSNSLADTMGFSKPGKLLCTFQGLTILGGWRSCVMFAHKGAAYADLTWIGCDFRPASSFGTKWGLHPVQCSNQVFDSCQFTEFAEHGIYDHSRLGRLTIDNCEFSRCGRTGLQAVGRMNEYDKQRSIGELILRKTHFSENGALDGGGAITLVGQKNPVRISDTTVTSAQPNANALVSSSDYFPAEGKIVPSPNGAILLDGFSAVLTGSKRELAIIGDCTHFLVKRSTFLQNGPNPHVLSLNPLHKPRHFFRIGGYTASGGNVGETFAPIAPVYDPESEGGELMNLLHSAFVTKAFQFGKFTGGPDWPSEQSVKLKGIIHVDGKPVWSGESEV